MIHEVGKKTAECLQALRHVRKRVGVDRRLVRGEVLRTESCGRSAWAACGGCSDCERRRCAGAHYSRRGLDRFSRCGPGVLSVLVYSDSEGREHRVSGAFYLDAVLRIAFSSEPDKILPWQEDHRSLLYDDHPIPKKSRALKERLKVPVAIRVGSDLYRRHRVQVRQLPGRRPACSTSCRTIESGQYDEAYQEWDADGRYTIKDFLQDWGKDGYYTKGMHEASVVDSNGAGGAVTVYVGIDSLKSPVALRVDKETLKISFSPVSKYPSP